MRFIYARTSTTEQNVSSQADSLAESYPDAEIRVEQLSGRDMSRPVLNALLVDLRGGDTLIVSEISRLSRNTVDFLSLLEDLEARNIGLIVNSLGGQPVDTRSAVGRMILTVLSAAASMERSLMLERQQAGIAQAKAKGKYRGRQVNPETARKCQAAHTMWASRKFSKAEACKRAGVSQPTLNKFIRDSVEIQSELSV